MSTIEEGLGQGTTAVNCKLTGSRDIRRYQRLTIKILGQGNWHKIVDSLVEKEQITQIKLMGKRKHVHCLALLNILFSTGKP